MKAWTVTAHGWDHPIVTTQWAKSRSAARMIVARMAREAGYFDNRHGGMAKLLPLIKAVRDPKRDSEEKKG